MNRLLQNYALWIIAAFALVFACSHRFAYVEGDDATSIAYHVLGRDASLQPPYSAYNGMMDKLLSFLPPNESVVRVAAFGISSLAAVLFVLLALKLVFDWLGQVTPVQRVTIALITLAACPELFFLGMAYTPGLVAMCFMLGAHLALRHGLRPGATAGGHRPAWGWFLASIALFGFGASCRWEALTYGIVPVLDLWLGFSAHRMHKPSLRQVAFGIVWGALALISAFAFIGVSGYGPKAMIDFVKLSQKASSGELRAGSGYGLRNVIGIYQPFFTPAFLLLLLIGLFSTMMKSRALLLKALIGVLPLLPMIFNGAPKLLLAAFPGLALLVAVGIEKLWFALRSGPRLTVTRIALAVLVLGPWLVGVRIFSKDTQWGPGFEVRTASAESQAGDTVAAGKARSIGIAGVKPALGAGFAFSTPEGPRPFGGFGAVLLGGGWRNHLSEREAERRKVIEQALVSKQPILQDDGNALVLIHLLEQGFSTKDKAPKAVLKLGEVLPWDENGLVRRTFAHADGRAVSMLQLKGNSLLFKPDQLDKLVSGAKLGPVILHSGYSSTLAKLFKTAPQSAQALGPFSATVELSQLQKAIAAHARRDGCFETQVMKDLRKLFSDPNNVVGNGGCLIIGEVAQAHDGSLGMAHAYIDAIANAGADAVKFQTHIASAESTPSEQWRVKFSLQDKTRYDYWKRMEFTEEQWHGLKKHADERGLLFLSSPFSIEAVDLLTRVGVSAWKVASGELGSVSLLDRMIATGLPFILSSGMSALDELDSAVTRAKKAKLPLAVLQCTTAYPCPPEKIGFNQLALLRERYGCVTGLSDHSGTIYPGLAGIALGMGVLEVHVTMSREMFGPDVKASVTCEEFKQMIEGVRFIEKALASPVDKNAMAAEMKPLRHLFNKSIVARMDLDAGTILKPEHLALKKPGTGLSEERLPGVLGKKLKHALKADALLSDQDLA